MLDETTIVEMVRPQEGKETAFLVFRDDGLQLTSSVENGPIRLVPFSYDNNLLSHGVVLLPTEADDYGDDASLFARVRSFVHKYADLSPGFEEAASYYVLLSWVYDAFSELPYLRLKGDFGTGKTRCLLTIGSICYKPMFVSGASTVSPMFRIIDAFRGTLILDESDFRFSDEKAEIIKILNNGNAAGFPVLRSEVSITKEFNPRAFNVFGPKIIATRGDFDDRALESRCITEVMTGLPPREDVPLSLPRSFGGEATTLRNSLLMYRFRTLNRPRSLERFRHAVSEARIAQVFAPLLSMVSDPEAQERIRVLARSKAAGLYAERNASIEAQLLGIISEMCSQAIPLSVKEITKRFVERHAEDFQRPISPRWVGGQLRRRLSLVPVKRHGTFVVPETDRRLLALFERYGLKPQTVDLGTSGMFDGGSEAMSKHAEAA